MSELREKMIELGSDPDRRDIEKELARKDGTRRFSKLVEERSYAAKSMPPLLTASAFPGRLDQYQTLIGHVEKLWADACEFYFRNNFPLASFLSILVVEEIGKLARLSEELIYFDVPFPNVAPQAIERSHRKKHFIGVVSGALVNARLDRVLGKDKVRRILHEAESDEFEKVRQQCLYIDVENDRTVTPSERIGENRARDLTILAGELMAEVLGTFPWEFERMIENVVAFERRLGLPEAKFVRG